MGLQPEAYVELVAVAASSVIVDNVRPRAFGMELPELPEPEPGAPTFERSDDVVDGGAWLPIKSEGRANILRSLGLVPSALKLFFDTFDPSYYMRPRRGILDQPAAGRTRRVAGNPAVNECFY